jgi:hypothetical protein
MSKLAPVLAAVAALGVVGGAAAVHFGSSEQPQRVVQIAPAAQTVEPSPTTTVAPSPTATVAPAPVESSQAPAPAPKVVQKKVTVAQEPAPQTTTSEPRTVVTGGAGTSTKIQPGQQPIVVAPVLTPSPTE